MTSDKEKFFIEAKLEAYEGNNLVFEKEIKDCVLRDNRQPNNPNAAGSHLSLTANRGPFLAQRKVATLYKRGVVVKRLQPYYLAQQRGPRS